MFIMVDSKGGKMEKLTGIVKVWNADQGFGFIEVPDEEDVFVHYSGIMTPHVRDLVVGQPVKFVMVKGARGWQAAGVETEEGEVNGR